MPAQELRNPVLSNRILNASCLKDAVSEDLDLRMGDRNSQGLLRHSPFGQMLFLTRAEFLEGKGLVFAFRSTSQLNPTM